MFLKTWKFPVKFLKKTRIFCKIPNTNNFLMRYLPSGVSHPIKYICPLSPEALGEAVDQFVSQLLQVPDMPQDVGRRGTSRHCGG